MKQDELITQLNGEIRATNMSADKAGKITIEEIESIESATETFQKDDKTITSKRFYLTLKGNAIKVMMPYSAMSQLQELMKTHKVKAFTVLKTGSGMTTKYNIAPELESITPP